MNDDLMVRTLARIERDRSRWDQQNFPVGKGKGEDCGTSYCLAGHAVFEAGERWTNPERAMKLLDLPHDCPVVGSLLFRPNLSLHDLYVMAAERMGVAVEVLRDKVREAV